MNRETFQHLDTYLEDKVKDEKKRGFMKNIKKDFMKKILTKFHHDIPLQYDYTIYVEYLEPEKYAYLYSDDDNNIVENVKYHKTEKEILKIDLNTFRILDRYEINCTYLEVSEPYLCTFHEGRVAVYDMRQRKEIYSVENQILNTIMIGKYLYYFVIDSRRQFELVCYDVEQKKEINRIEVKLCTIQKYKENLLLLKYDDIVCIYTKYLQPIGIFSLDIDEIMINVLSLQDGSFIVNSKNKLIVYSNIEEQKIKQVIEIQHGVGMKCIAKKYNRFIIGDNIGNVYVYDASIYECLHKISCKNHIVEDTFECKDIAEMIELKIYYQRILSVVILSPHTFVVSYWQCAIKYSKRRDEKRMNCIQQLLPLPQDVSKIIIDYVDDAERVW